MFEPTFQRHVMNLVLCHRDHEILYWPRIEAPLYGIPSACATSDNRHISRKRDFFFLLPLAGELNDHAITSIAVWTFCKAFFSCSRSTQCAKISFLLFSTKSEQSYELRAELVSHSYLGLDSPQYPATSHDTIVLPYLELFPNLPFAMSEMPSDIIPAPSLVYPDPHYSMRKLAKAWNH